MPFCLLHFLFKVCVWSREVRKQLSRSRFSFQCVGSRDWTQSPSLTTSAFAQWATLADWANALLFLCTNLLVFVCIWWGLGGFTVDSAYKTTHPLLLFIQSLFCVICVLGASNTEMRYDTTLKKPSVSKKKQAGRSGTLDWKQARCLPVRRADVYEQGEE